eukprot:TRINITY_DN38750_c0_g1_i1.p1 TRINITY_DN38750_c0_g1~~TRINITY_DN38750_c0_g1_i1.p1  ORF type:complete len:408 (+),score=71.19 TRINITY_DN38750_c0_g1_i1:104-1327(+)
MSLKKTGRCDRACGMERCLRSSCHPQRRRRVKLLPFLACGIVTCNVAALSRHASWHHIFRSPGFATFAHHRKDTSQHRRTAVTLPVLATFGVLPVPAFAEGIQNDLSADDISTLKSAFAALEADPRRPEARAEVEKAANDLERVIGRFNELKASPGEVVRLRMARAQALILANDLTGGKLPEKAEAAIKEYTESIRLMESDSAEDTFDYPSTFVRRALAKEELAFGRKDASQWAGAVEDYSRAIDLWRSRPIAPTGLGVNPMVLNFRGNALSQLGRYKDASVDYVEAADIFMRDRELEQAYVSRCNEALALFGDGQRDEAIQVLKSVQAKTAALADTHVALAAVYWVDGDVGRAESEWRYACENTAAGCVEYKNLEWVQSIRRWPPALIADLKLFLERQQRPVAKVS